MVHNGPQWSPMGPIGPKWSKMVPYESKWPQMILNGPKWSQMVPNSPKRSQMVPNWSKLFQMVLNGPKWTLWYALRPYYIWCFSFPFTRFLVIYQNHEQKLSLFTILSSILCVVILVGQKIGINITIDRFVYLSRSHKARAPKGRPNKAWAFDELRRYHTRPSRFNWAPKKYILGKCILGTQILPLGFFR